MSIVKQLYEKVFGSHNTHTIASYQQTVDIINAVEATYSALSNDELQAKTAIFKDRLAQGETLDALLPDAFATVRETAKRLMGMRHHDVQLIGGMAIHYGNIAEMRTGEGKTLVATLPAYLNALTGKGVHVITVNDYLARRDAIWMGQIYDFLGLRVGIVQQQRVSYVYDKTAIAQPDTQEGSEIDRQRDEQGSFKIEYEYVKPATRKEAYQCDITYGTNNEFGFDYLRDNMVQTIDDMVMRPQDEMVYAIIDEIDSILIDEARTPLIISAPAEEATNQYYQFATLVKKLDATTDYVVDEKIRSVTLTEQGIHKFETWLGVENIYVAGGMRTVHHIEQALKAEVLFKKDRDYVVEQGTVVIIDEFTGRKMPGRRYSEGLHQAIEAKEQVKIQRESKTLATITFQNLFRMYTKLGGMTGTASTEAEEFTSIYGLDVITIPTNKQDRRTDHSDRIYKNERIKYKAIAAEVKERQAKGQPVLIGTISVEKNEALSAYLTAAGIQHEVLNAKNHEREGEIIAQAGRPGAVTLATNIAGRGVDIKLGGVPYNAQLEASVRAAGGLFVLGSERHESRRIDNQLRGRSARQGDPGETQFYVSTDDDLMRIFGGDRLNMLMTRLNVPDDMPIEQKTITKMLETAQKKVEGHHFDLRKHLLEYDDVLNKQRQVIYGKRRDILNMHHNDDTTKTTENSIKNMIEQEIEFVVSYHTNTQSAEGTQEWNMEGLVDALHAIIPLQEEEKQNIKSIVEEEKKGKLQEVQAREHIISLMIAKTNEQYERIKQALQQTAGAGGMQLQKEVEKGLLLRAIDTLWVEYLVEIQQLRRAIGLRGYAQREPLIEYKKESYSMFQSLLANIQKEVVYSFFKMGLGIQLAPSIMETEAKVFQGVTETGQQEITNASETTVSDSDQKIGRNDACHCGSGKKYKKCHGA